MIELIISNFPAISGAILLASFVGYISWRNNRISRRAAACASFRSSMNDTLLRLRHGSDATAIIVFQNNDTCVAAINSFRHYVPRLGKRGFKKAEEQYYLQANIQLSKFPMHAILLDATPEAIKQRAELLGAVEAMLEYAKET